MEQIIERKSLGMIDGFAIVAVIVPDTDSHPDDADCYAEADKQAWREGRWSYVGTIVTAFQHGVELGSSSLWGSEYGYSPSWGKDISPLDGEGDEFVNGYGPGLIAEAIAEAKEIASRISASITQPKEVVTVGRPY